MSPKESVVEVPPVEAVRKRLAAATAEARYLRRLLRISREKDEAQRLRAEADATKGGQQ